MRNLRRREAPALSVFQIFLRREVAADLFGPGRFGDAAEKLRGVDADISDAFFCVGDFPRGAQNAAVYEVVAVGGVGGDARRRGRQQMQRAQFAAEFGEFAKLRGVFRIGDAREIYFQKLVVAFAVGGGVQDRVNVIQQVNRGESFFAGFNFRGETQVEGGGDGLDDFRVKVGFSRGFFVQVFLGGFRVEVEGEVVALVTCGMNVRNRPCNENVLLRMMQQITLERLIALRDCRR